MIGSDTLAERMEAVTQFDRDGIDDESLLARARAQEKYLGHISESPLIGKGGQAARKMIAEGYLLKPSHNQFLESAFAYGVGYLVMIGYFIWKLQRLSAYHQKTKNAYFLFLFVTLWYGMAANTLFINKVYFVFIGYMLWLTLYEDTSRDRISEEGRG